MKLNIIQINFEIEIINFINQNFEKKQIRHQNLFIF